MNSSSTPDFALVGPNVHFNFYAFTNYSPMRELVGVSDDRHLAFKNATLMGDILADKLNNGEIDPQKIKELFRPFFDFSSGRDIGVADLDTTELEKHLKEAKLPVYRLRQWTDYDRSETKLKIYADTARSLEYGFELDWKLLEKNGAPLFGRREKAAVLEDLVVLLNTKKISIGQIEATQQLIRDRSYDGRRHKKNSGDLTIELLEEIKSKASTIKNSVSCLRFYAGTK